MEIGIDIEKVERFNFKDNSFTKKVFTQSELKYSSSKSNPSQTLCGIFCAKEALIKALMSKNIEYSDIEVAHNNEGIPFISLKNNSSRFKLSISHTSEYACAVVLKLD
jgi:holo-[acyl-carrier protein] synthase